LNLAWDSRLRGAAPHPTYLILLREYFLFRGDIMIAMIIGGTNPASLRLNFSKEARTGSSSKRLITTEA
jgi:hypothetical protein